MGLTALVVVLVLAVLAGFAYLRVRGRSPIPPPTPGPTPPPVPGPAPTPPFITVAVLEPNGTGPVSPATRLRYLVRGTPVAVSAQVEFSADGGNTWGSATPLTGGGGAPTTGFPPDGSLRLFVWDSVTDVGGAPQPDLLLRVTATDGSLVDTDQTAPFDTVPALPASVVIRRVWANRTDRFVRISYALHDAQPSLTRVAVRFSTDQGQTWAATTEESGVGSEGTLGLTASPAGDVHRFAWAAAADLGAPSGTDLLLQVEALDTRAGGSDITAPFDFGVPTPPVVRWVAPRGGTVRSPVMVRCVVADADADPADVTLQYSTDGGTTFLSATASGDAWSESRLQVTTSPDGEGHLFGWDAERDVGQRRTGVILRAFADDGAVGPAAESLPFDVDTTAAAGRIQVLNPVSGAFRSPIPLQYVITGPGSFGISLDYSLDGGVQWSAAAIDTGISDPVTGVVAGPPAVVFWDAAADLAGLGRVDDAVLKVRASDGGVVLEGWSGPVDVTVNAVPGVRIVSPTGGLVPAPTRIEYELTDFESDAVDVDVRWSVDGGATFRPATAVPGAPGHEGAVGLTSSFGGEVHGFVWDSAADLGPGPHRDVLVRIEPRDPLRGAAAVSAPFDVGPGAPPRVLLQAPGTPRVGTPVPVAYTVFDTGGPVDATVEYAVAGQPFQRASEAANARSEGLQGLTTSPAGRYHFFAWDAETDGQAGAASVVVRVTVRNAHGSASAESRPLAVDAARSGVPCSRDPSGTVSAPEIQLMNGTRVPGPAGGGGGGSYTATVNHQPIWFFVTQARGERCNVALEYRDAQGDFRPLTPAPDSDDQTDLAAPYPAKASYRVLWDVLGDLGVGTHQTVVRGTPYIGAVAGTPDVTVPMQITVPGIAPPATIPTAGPVVAPSLTIVDGDGQVGVAGFRLRDALRVRLADGTGAPLPGAEVTFTVTSSTGPAAADVALLPDPDLSTTTDTSGEAGVAVRAPLHPGPYRIEVTARVVGLPAVVQTFQLDARPGQWIADPQNPVTLEHGRPARLAFRLVADPAHPQRVDFAADVDEAFEIDVSALNGELSHSRLRLPSGIGPANEVAFDVVAHPLGSPAPGVPSTDAVQLALSGPWSWTGRIPVETPYNSWHYDGLDGSQQTEVRLHLALVEGLETSRTPQVAHGGLALVRKFRVEIRDDAGAVYSRSIDRADQFLCPPASTLATHTPQVMWAVTGGEVRSAAPAASGPSITVPIDVPVEFLPDGPGPWRLTATVDTVVRDRSRVWTYTTSSGQVRCRRAQHGLSVFASRTALVQRSARVELVAAAPPSHTLSRAKAGVRCRIRVSGLSAFRPSGTVQPVELETVGAAGTSIPTVPGYPHPFRQAVDMAPAAAGGTLESGVITLVRGIPSVAPADTHALVRNGYARLGYHDVVASLPTERKARTRDRVAASAASPVPDVIASLDSPAGTTPFDGVGSTVGVQSGEFVLDAVDLSIPTRIGTLSVQRFYRSQSTDSGDDETSPLGEGWFLGWDEHLDVSSRWTRWHTTEAHPVDFAPGFGADPLRPGYLVRLERRQVHSSDDSPYVIVDGEGNETHFHADGSLRFRRDRQGNRFDCEYDLEGRLTRIYDCIDRSRYFELAYFHSSSPDPREGRLIEIRDDTSRRVVDLEYFTTPADKAGLLREVSYPAVTTVGSGGVAASRRPETYDYVVGPTGRRRLSTVTDAEQELVLGNTYDGIRVSEQSHQGSSRPVKIDHDPATRTAVVTDGEGQEVEMEFPESPYWDAAAPRSTTVRMPGAPTTTAVHNRDGLVLELTFPAGNKARYGYEEFVPGTTTPAPARRRANLLREDRVSTAGQTRTTTHRYGRDNVLLATVPPRGNLPGADPLMYQVRQVWDGPTRTLRRRILPPVLSMNVRDLDPALTAPGGAPVPRLWYFHGWRGETFEWTPDGRPSKAVDIAGVVTRYLYYPASDWNGSGGGSPTPVGGGLLAQVVRDAEATPERDKQLPGIPLALETTRYGYDVFGNLSHTVDPRGVRHEIDGNEALEAEGVIDAASIPSGTSTSSVRPARRRFVQRSDVRGQAASIRQDEPVVGSGEGGSEVGGAVYDTLGLLEREELAVSVARRLTARVLRDGNANPRGVEEPGRSTFPASGFSVIRDARGMVATLEEGGSAAPRTTIFRRAPDGVLESTVAPDGTVSTRRSDGFRELVGEIDPRGNVEHALVDAVGVPIRTVWIHAGAQGNPRRALSPSGGTVAGFQERVVDAHGRLVRVHTGLFQPSAPATAGERIHLAPERPGPSPVPWPPVERTTLPDGAWGPCDGRVTTDYGYDTRGLLSRVVDDEGAVTLIRRDALGRIVQTTWETGRHVMEYRYDEAGNPVETELRMRWTGGGARRTSSILLSQKVDARGRVWERVDGKGASSGVDHSSRGAVDTETDARGQSVRLHPDGLGRTTAVEVDVANNPYVLSGTIRRSLTFHDSGAPDSLTEDSGTSAVFGHDPAGRLETVAYDHGTVRTVYDPVTGYVSHTVDGEGTDVHHEYAGGLLRRLVVPNPPAPRTTVTLEYEHDGGERIVLARDATTGHQVRIEYDSVGGVLAEVQGGERVEYSKRPDLRRDVMRHPSGLEVQYSHDRTGRLTHVRAGSRVVARFSRRLPTAVSHRILGPVRCEYGQDGNGRVELVEITGLSGGTVRVDLERDADGRLEKCTRTDGAHVEEWVWSYDEPGRLSSETYSIQTPGGTRTVRTTRAFDGDDVLREERVVEQDGGATVSDVVVRRGRAGRGRITDETGALPVEYDQNGSLTRLGSRRFTYDAWHRLVRVTDQGQDVADFEYDALHRLVRRVTPEDEETYVYDAGHLVEVRRDGAVSEQYVYSAATDDVVFARVEGQEYHVISDPMGNVSTLVDGSGVVVERYRYTLRGEVQVLDDAYSPIGGLPSIRLGFQRRVLDRVTGLVYFRARWYLPELGVFLTPDPAGYANGTDHYGLNHGDPVNYSDPSGHDDRWVNSGDVAEDPSPLMRAVRARSCMDCHGDWRVLNAGLTPDVMPWFNREAVEEKNKQFFTAISVAIPVGGGWVLGGRLGLLFVRSGTSAFRGGILVNGFRTTGAAAGMGTWVTADGLINPPPPPPPGPSFNVAPTRIYAGVNPEVVNATILMMAPGGGSAVGPRHAPTAPYRTTLRLNSGRPAGLRARTPRDPTPAVRLTMLEGGGRAARGTEGNHMAGTVRVEAPDGSHPIEWVRCSGGGPNRHFETNVRREILPGPLGGGRGAEIPQGSVIHLRAPYDVCNLCKARRTLTNLAADTGSPVWYRSGEGTHQLSTPGNVRVQFRPNGSVQWDHWRPDGTKVVRNYFRARNENGTLADEPGRTRHPEGAPVPRNWPPPASQRCY